MELFGELLLIGTLVIIAAGIGALFMLWMEEQRDEQAEQSRKRPYHMARRR